MDNLQEQLTRARIEDKDGSIDWLGCQVTLKRLVDSHTVGIGVVDEPNDLVAKQLTVVLRTQVWLGRLTGIQLKSLPDTLAKDVQGKIGFDDLGHCLLQQWLASGDVVSKSTVERILQIKCKQTACWRWVDTPAGAGAGAGVAVEDDVSVA